EGTRRASWLRRYEHPPFGLRRGRETPRGRRRRDGRRRPFRVGATAEAEIVSAVPRGLRCIDRPAPRLASRPRAAFPGRAEGFFVRVTVRVLDPFFDVAGQIDDAEG